MYSDWSFLAPIWASSALETGWSGGSAAVTGAANVRSIDRVASRTAGFLVLNEHLLDCQQAEPCQRHVDHTIEGASAAGPPALRADDPDVGITMGRVMPRQSSGENATPRPLTASIPTARPGSGPA